MSTSNPKLGVVYSAKFLKDALKAEPPSREYVSVGLIFKEVVKKEPIVETLYFSNKKDDAFSNKTTLKVNKTYVSCKNGAKKLDKDDEVSKRPGDQESIKNESEFQFWDVFNTTTNSDMKPLVYFSRNDIDFLLAGNVKTVTFSGAQIDYGIGLRDFEKEAVNTVNKSAYPTLKGESNIGNNKDGPLIPNVALALPCPPIWEDDHIDTKSNVNKDILNKMSESIENNYIKYKSEEVVRSATGEIRAIEIIDRSLTIKNLIGHLER